MWMDDAEALFGARWQQPLAELCRVSDRSVQRWAADGTCPPGVEAWLAETIREIPPELLRAYAACLRASLRAGGAAVAVADRVSADLRAQRLP